jgi:putative CocE/NonD family hydrolase
MMTYLVRRAGSRRWLALLTGSIVLAGTASVAAASSDRDECRDPYPCEQAWPDGMTGPFALKEVRNVQVRSQDGTLLDGWIASPTVPAGVRTPTILMSSPYFDVSIVSGATIAGNPSTPPAPDCPVTGQGCGFWSDGPMTGGTGANSFGFPPIRLIREGYTLAFFSVRGTGSSGGCWEWGGLDEQRDQAVLVDWVADQPWSNGRVGMGGLSYLSWTTWQAAVQAPKALKAIVTAGDLVDFYQLLHSPQGAWGPGVSALIADAETELDLGAGATSGRTQFLEHEACPHMQTTQRGASALLTGDRDAAYWQERNLSLRLQSVRAAVLDTTGYLDVGHQFQDDAIWGSLARETPKVQLRGWWRHVFPSPQQAPGIALDFPSGTVAWETMVVRWFDYWLKGIGPVPQTPHVYHQDQEARWHEASSWSVRPAGKQVLYLTGEALTPAAQGGSTSFLAAPPPDAAWVEHAEQLEPDSSGVESSLCQDPVGATLSRRYLTQPVSAGTLLAGNPFAYLHLMSDQPGGIVTATLYDLAPGFSCTGSHWDQARWISSGAADLSYHGSPFLAHPFPVGVPALVRMDLSDVTYTLAPGHRLALVLDHGSVVERGGSTTFPIVTVLGDSHLVIPVAEGTLGGMHPTTRYPQRPFTPRGYRD